MKSLVSPVSLALFAGLGTVAAAAIGTSGNTASPAAAPVPATQLAQAPADPALAPKPNDPAVLAELIAEGGLVFRRNCAECHGSAGEGGGAPRLAASEKLQSETLILNQILFGSEYMPTFATVLDDREVAAVGTFIRNSWGNAYPAITEEAVALVRPR